MEKIQEYLNYLLAVDQLDFIERAVVLVVYCLLAWALNRFVVRGLKRLAEKTDMPFDDFLFDFIKNPLALTLIVLGVIHAAAIVPALPIPYDFIVPCVLKSFLLVIWGRAVLRSVNKLDEHSAAVMLRREDFDRDLFFLFKNISRIVIVFSVVLWILTVWEIELTPIFASAGIAGIAIALAAKDTLANFFGGISIYMDRAYKVGEYIILESGERGEVVEVGIRSTKIKTRDDVMITIPNSIMANSMVINESAPNPRFRIRVDVGVAYGSDLDFVEQTILNIAKQNDGVVQMPEPRVRVRALADSSVNFQLHAWIKDPREKGGMIHKLIKEIYKEFNQTGISIPFPQRDIHIKEAPEEKE